MKILLATTSYGKLKEMKELFKSLGNDIELLTLNDFPKVEEAVEDGNTFLANAYIKVMYYYNCFKIPTIADDTGLLVEALNNAPGVLTARYGSINGEHTDPVKNYMRILHELEGIKNRNAKFVTAMYFYDGKCLINALGEMKGEISLHPSGTNGFGYDPIFYLPKFKCCVAELDAEIKNQISHRGNASKNLITQLYKYLKN